MNACEIGESAGRVWQCLSDNGPMDPAAMAKKTGLKKEIMFAAIGWLARENKLAFEQGKRKMLVSLM